jgi:hypothetical protein
MLPKARSRSRDVRNFFTNLFKPNPAKGLSRNTWSRRAVRGHPGSSVAGGGWRSTRGKPKNRKSKNRKTKYRK